MRKFIGAAAAALIVGVLGFATVAGACPSKVTICHATASKTNPYVKITVDVASILNGHGHGYGGVNSGDIIPAFTYVGPGGKILTRPAEGNQAILANGCKTETTTTTVPPTTTPTTVPVPVTTTTVPGSTTTTVPPAIGAPAGSNVPPSPEAVLLPSAPIAGATGVHTGEWFAGSEGLAGFLLGVGSTLVAVGLVIRRKIRKARKALAAFAEALNAGGFNQLL